MIAGILFNPGAGGSAVFPAAAEAALACFGTAGLVTCQGEWGAARLPGVRTIEAPALPFVPRVLRSVELLVSSGADLLVCVGGDGFAAYCAGALVRRGFRVPLLGVAAGTANVGPLLRFDAAALARTRLGSLRPEDLGVRPVHALECRPSDPGPEPFGLAFNDVVVGDTFLGTLEGRAVNLGLREFLESGRRVARVPSTSITGPGFRVLMDGVLQDHRGPVAQIVASPLNDEGAFRGRAVAGALCAASWNAGIGALALLDTVWVSMHARPSGFSCTRHLVFGEGNVVTLDGLSEDGQIVLDGNPFLRPPGGVEIRCLPRAIMAVEPA